ncbi:MAG TPA: trypsin-like peptidase domain-containing protein, partial [Armatimonadota bacterium]|nr:trypsin-like peptidase domain-containing protein [Armatimonadota bacterium]
LFIMVSAACAQNSLTSKDIVNKWGGSVVQVRMAAKVSMSYMGESDSREETSEITGVMIDPSGLTVVSAMATNPVASLQDLIERQGISVTFDLTDLKIVLPDGKEIPAKLVLSDKDLDVALIRPTQAVESPLPYIDLKNSAKLDLLDQVLMISRMGKLANRASVAYLERIQAVVEKPRKFYIIRASSMGNVIGSPVFATDGKVLGVLLLRLVPGMLESESNEEPLIPVVVPAEDILSMLSHLPEN